MLSKWHKIFKKKKKLKKKKKKRTDFSEEGVVNTPSLSSFFYFLKIFFYMAPCKDTNVMFITFSFTGEYTFLVQFISVTTPAPVSMAS